MILIKKLPELHSSALEKYDLTFKDHLRKVHNLGEDLIGQDKFIKFLKQKIEKMEL